MANQVQPRRGTGRSSRTSKRRKTQPRRPRKVEMIALHSEAHCGSGGKRGGLRSLFRIGLVALLLLVPLLIGATSTLGYLTKLDPPPDSSYWQLNAPQAHGDPQRSGAVAIRLLDDRPDLRWSTTGFAPFLAGPVMDEANAYVVDRKGVVAALNLSTGEEVWRIDLKQEVRATPALAYGWLYVATEAKELHALSAHSGTAIHKVKLDGAARAAPLVTEGRVFIGTEAGSLQVFDATTLDPLWNFKTSTLSYANGTVGTEDKKLLKPIRSAPAAYDGKVYIGAWNGRAYAFSTHGNVEGHPSTMVWTRTLADILHAAPVVDRHHGLVIYATADGHLQALHRSSGSFAWVVDAGGAFAGSVAVNKTHLVAATTDGRLLGVNPANGRVDWQHYDPGGYIAAPIVVDDGIVTLSANGTLMLRSGSDGLPLKDAAGDAYTWRVGDGTHATPAVTKRGIVIVDQGGSVTLIGPRPRLTSDLAASLARFGNTTAGAEVQLHARVENLGPDIAPGVTGTLAIDGTIVDTIDIGRLNNSAARDWNHSLSIAPGAHKIVVQFTTNGATDPAPARAVAVLNIEVAAPPDLASGGAGIPTKGDGSVDLDELYGRDIDGDLDGSPTETRGFTDGVRAAWSPWMLPAILVAIVGGIVLGRMVKKRADADATG